jgi:hypothetical protein
VAFALVVALNWQWELYEMGDKAADYLDKLTSAT